MIDRDQTLEEGRGGIVNVLALCAGIGGLERGVDAALGGSSRVVCYVEGGAFAAANLVGQMQAGRLDPAPIWSDVRSFDGAPWRGVVDLVTAGFPCQPHSGAGLGKGRDDHRWLWDDVDRIIGEVGPDAVFLENVPGIATTGLVRVVSDLAARGFRVAWDVFRASDDGAPHIRERIFVLADTDSARCQGGVEHGERIGSDQDPSADAFSKQIGHVEQWRPGGRAGSVCDEGSAQPRHDGLARNDSDPDRGGCEERHDGIGEDRPRWDIDEAPEPAICGVDDGVPDRLDRLHALGNAVVWPTAARAFRELRGRLDRC